MRLLLVCPLGPRFHEALQVLVRVWGTEVGAEGHPEQLVTAVSEQYRTYLVEHHKIKEDLAFQLIRDSRERATVGLADGVARATLPTLTGMAVSVVGLLFITRLEHIIRREDQRLHDRLARAAEDAHA